MRNARSDDIAIRAFVHELVKRSGMSASRLAVESGLADTTITRYLRGKSANHTISLRSLSKICATVGVHNPFAARSQEVPVVGTVASHGHITLAPAGRPTIQSAVAPAGIDPEEVWAVEVTDGAPFPPLATGWIVYAQRAAQPAQELVGKLCICKLAGSDEYLLRVLEPGHVPGTWTLHAPFAEPVRNVALEWAAKVIDCRQP